MWLKSKDNWINLGLVVLLLGVWAPSTPVWAEKAPKQGGKVTEKATFAGGCFWCMEPPFDALDGVVATTSGYAGGPEKNPTYEQVASAQTGHAEVVQIEYDPKKVTYQKLLDTFWMNIDPTTVNQSFVDVGPQYRTAIFYHNDEQKKLALASKKKLEDSKKFKKPIVTEISPLNHFFKAEDYHQDYYKKSPVNYYRYRRGSGRDEFIKKHWGPKK